LLRGIQLGVSAILNNSLATSSDNNYVCYECVNVPEVGVTSKKFLNAPPASLSDEDAAYLMESVVGGLYICKRVQSPTVCEGLQLRHKDRNDDSFAACLQV